MMMIGFGEIHTGNCRCRMSCRFDHLLSRLFPTGGLLFLAGGLLLWAGGLLLSAGGLLFSAGDLLGL